MEWIHVGGNSHLRLLWAGRCISYARRHMPNQTDFSHIRDQTLVLHCFTSNSFRSDFGNLLFRVNANVMDVVGDVICCTGFGRKWFGPSRSESTDNSVSRDTLGGLRWLCRYLDLSHFGKRFGLPSGSMQATVVSPTTRSSLSLKIS